MLHGTQQLQIYNKYRHTYREDTGIRKTCINLYPCYIIKLFKLRNRVICITTISSRDLENM